jgi:hypothetical protein
MHRIFVTLGLWFTLVLSAHGLNVVIPVTTTNLDQYKYRFSISTNAATSGVAFHVIVTAKKEDIYADSAAGLSIVTITKTGHSVTSQKPEIPVRVNKDKRAWHAEFTVPFELLEKPGLSFVFTEISHGTVDGKSVPLTSVDFYAMNLRDFLKQ